MSARMREVPAKTDPAIPGPPRGSMRIDMIALRRALRHAVDGEVRPELYATITHAQCCS